MKFGNLPIRQKVGVVILSVVGLAILSNVLSTFIFQSVAFRKRAQSELLTLASVIGGSVNASVMFGDSAEATRILDHFRLQRYQHLRETTEVHLFNLSGNALFASTPAGAQPPGELVSKGMGIYSTDKGLWLIHELKDESGRTYAHMALHSSLHNLQREERNLILVLGAITVLTLLVAYYLGRRLQQSLTRPISSLASTVQEIAEKGNQNLRAEKFSDDEVGNLADNVNQMLDTLDRQDQALRESEALFRSQFEYGNIGIAITSVEKGWLQANACLCKMLGYTEQELKKMTWTEMTYPDDLAPDLEQFERMLKGEIENYEMDKRFFRKDGDLIYTHLTVSCFRNLDRTIKFVIASLLDITEHKKAEEALLISEEKYRLVVENASEAIFILQDEIIKFPNRQSIVMSGYTEKEITGMHFPHFLHNDDKDIVMDRLQRRLRGEDVPPVYSFRIINKTGKIIWVEISAVLLTWEGKIATLNFLRDITAQKKLEEQLLQSQKMEAVGQLAGGVAHDFNNLLTAIIGYGHLIKNEASKDERISAYVSQVLNAAERAAVLTTDLLTFSRKQIVNLQPVNLNTIIKNMESLLLRVIGEDIEPSTDLMDAELTILADSTQIDQILMNLATNAQDAMSKGGSLLIKTERMEINGEYVRAHGYGKAGAYALLSVEDTGTGMDEKIREKIFEPFFTTKEVGKGTGLGLAMVYSIVKQHDGYINVYSEPGKGTTFKILLPHISSKVKSLKDEGLQNAKGGIETILIGEDDQQVRNLLKEVLSHAGYNIIEAVDGDDAIKVFHENKDKIDLLILDVIMPKKNGKEVYDEIRKVKSDIKVIFVSGYSADIMNKKGILEFGLNFISKPVSPDKLLIKIRDILDN